jgi:hypothetical protein
MSIQYHRAIIAAKRSRQAKEKADLFERVGLKASASRQRAIQEEHERIVIRIAGRLSKCPPRAR